MIKAGTEREKVIIGRSVTTIRRVLKAFAFILIFSTVLINISDRLIPADAHWFISRENIQGIYRLQKDIVDLVSIGGSSCYHSFSPYELYMSYGISSYCFGTSNQPLNASYYILKDIVKTQSPKMVVLEAENLTGGSSEAFTRRVLDVMPFSQNKLQSIIDHTRTDGADSLLSYIFPLTKYHSAWKDITAKSFLNASFIVNPVSNETMYLGFVMVSGQYGKEYTPILDTSIALADYNAEGLDYCTRIVDFCEEYGIRLLLYSSLKVNWTVEKHNSTQAFADQYHLQYIDFNMDDVYTSANLSYLDDLWDTAHLNTFGAIKATRYLGEIITQSTAFPDRRNDPQYAYLAKELPEYEHWVRVQRLQVEKNMMAYLEDVAVGKNSADYSVYFTVKDEATNNMGNELKETFRKYGFTVDFTDKYRFSFLGVIQGGKVVYEQFGKDIAEALTYTGNNIDGTAYSLESAGYGAGNRSVMQVGGGSNLSRNTRGFNVVVYDNRLHRVVDSVTWDTCAADTVNQAQHKAMTP